MKFHAAFRAHFEDATIEFNGAQSPSLTVYKKDGTCGDAGTKAEYEAKVMWRGSMFPIWDHIIQKSNISRNASEKIKPVEVAPLIEGVRSVQLGIKEWNAAKEYVDAHESK